MPFQIPSTTEWTNTGIKLETTQDDKFLTFTVDIGPDSRWTANPNPQGGGFYDARGFLEHKPIGTGYKIQTANEGCLVCKIEGTAFVFTFDSNIIEVKDHEIKVGIKLDGRLQGNILLGINDNVQGLIDNQGVILVKVIDSN